MFTSSSEQEFEFISDKKEYEHVKEEAVDDEQLQAVLSNLDDVLSQSAVPAIQKIVNDNEIRIKNNFSPLSIKKSFMNDVMHNSIDCLAGDKNPLGLVQLNSVEQPFLKLYIMTWNMQGKNLPKAEEIKVFMPFSYHHMYVFGTQECERSIGASMLNPSKQKWEATLIEVMGSKYVMIKSHTMMAIHIVIFVRREIQHLITNITVSNVATGLADSIGNKGSASISFTFCNSTKLLFINSHLAAHQSKIEDRNANFHRIMSETVFKIDDDTGDNGSVSSVKDSHSDAEHLEHYPIQDYFNVNLLHW
ncbi:phosphatidylinositol phosphatase [Acrasis kona]|uniref:Phosphatidylinositol phosphatase n=1 Tax=Acrasis kona TaxID=1008807 RepID=A0AAW2ZMK9_9EUKA